MSCENSDIDRVGWGRKERDQRLKNYIYIFSSFRSHKWTQDSCSTKSAFPKKVSNTF